MCMDVRAHNTWMGSFSLPLTPFLFWWQYTLATQKHTLCPSLCCYQNEDSIKATTTIARYPTGIHGGLRTKKSHLLCSSPWGLMWKEQHSGCGSYLKCMDWPLVRQQSKLPTYCSSAIKVRERAKLPNCVKGLDPTTTETAWGLYFFNSWLFLFILCSPLYLHIEPWNHSLDAFKTWNRPTSTVSSLQALYRLLL